MRPLLALLLFFSPSSFGYSGNQLLEDLNSTDVMSVGFALGYIGGVSQAASTTGVEGKCIKLPNGITGQQTNKIAEKYLEDNPQLTHINAQEIVLLSLITAFGFAEAYPDSEGDFCPYGKG